jgi:hypothetical protein
LSEPQAKQPPAGIKKKTAVQSAESEERGVMKVVAILDEILVVILDAIRFPAPSKKCKNSLCFLFKSGCTPFVSGRG